MILIPLIACTSGSVTLDDDTVLSTDSSDSSWDSSWDSSSDSTVDTAPEELQPDYLVFTQYWGWDEGPRSYFSEGTEVPPFVVVTYYDERFFEAGDEQYYCYEYFLLVNPTETDRWGTYTFDLSHAPWTDNPCPFGPGPMDGEELEMGVDTLSEGLKAEIQQAVEDNGDDFSELEPFLLGARVGPYEIGYGVLLEVDEDMAILPGDNCFVEGAACVEVDGLEALPGPVMLWGTSWYLVTPADF